MYHNVKLVEFSPKLYGRYFVVRNYQLAVELWYCILLPFRKSVRCCKVIINSVFLAKNKKGAQQSCLGN